MGKALETTLAKTAKAAWSVFQAVNKRIPEGKPFQPVWADRPLLKSYEKVKPPLGWPRETDSLCPDCVKETRAKIINGEISVDVLRNEKPAEIKSKIIERDGKIWMVKDCLKHGHYEDVMAIDPKFLQRMEDLYPGSDFYAPHKIREHGSSSITYGRGSVMTIDLTNRCNMMCDPCFMDANQVGYVHELSLGEVKKILDDSISVKPRRQMSIQFSGGEPTISPHFIESIKYAKEVGYFSVQCATNGIRFAEDPEFAKRAYEAGLRIAYLQFDGVGNENHEHRKIGNLFDIKLRAMENLYNAGIDIVLVVTIVNTVNDHQVGRIIEFAVQNSDKISFISFQPVSFTGRDEDITPELRHAQRYTLSHLAHDVKKQTGLTEPLRDWFPLSAVAPFSDFTDMMKGPDQDWGTLKCGCHPNCGVGTVLLVNKETKEFAPLGEMLDIEQFLKDVTVINDAARGPKSSKAQMAMAILKNYNPAKAPKGFELKDLIQKFDKQSGGSMGGEYGVGAERKKDKWLFMFVAGMWFQDLWNYDFRRTERCIIPYGTQEGEISFCAYNTGVGWRNIVENMYKVSSVGKWYKEKGRHPVYADGKPVDLPSFDNTLKVPGLPSYDAAAKAYSRKVAVEKKVVNA
ncbi:MAG: radical SAM protein [Deltaproteobacteria bacterium]|nr:radical SAM protein [Deltaproteobacteria bacterium]